MARWLFRAAGGAPLPFLERKVARLLGGGGGSDNEGTDSFEYYRDNDGQLRSQIHAAPARAAPAPEAAAAPARTEAVQDEQIDAAAASSDDDDADDSTRLPPLPPPFAMYAAHG